MLFGDLQLLSLSVQRRLNVCVSHQFLLDFDWRFRAPQPRPVAVPECMPTDGTEARPSRDKFSITDALGEVGPGLFPSYIISEIPSSAVVHNTI